MDILPVAPYEECWRRLENCNGNFLTVSTCKRDKILRKDSYIHSTRWQSDPEPPVSRVYEFCLQTFFRAPWSCDRPSQVLYLDKKTRIHMPNGCRTYHYSVFNSWQQYAPDIVRPMRSAISTLQPTLFQNSVPPHREHNPSPLQS